MTVRNTCSAAEPTVHTQQSHDNGPAKSLHNARRITISNPPKFSRHILSVRPSDVEYGSWNAKRAGENKHCYFYKMYSDIPQSKSPNAISVSDKMKSYLSMTRYFELLVTGFILSTLPTYAQVTSFNENGGGVVSSLDENEGEDGIVQDWKTTLSEFGQVVTESSEEEFKKTTEHTERKFNLVSFAGKEFNLPTMIDDNGIDLFLLTNEGMAIYTAINPPAFFQDIDNDVAKWIRFYGYDKRKYTTNLFKRYDALKPKLLTAFRKYGVPDELSLLCLIESACTSNALSPVGAAGMWQIMPTTAQLYGLKVTPSVDERYDVQLSTYVAARYLKDAYLKTGSWTLAAASYNCGQGKTISIMKKNKGGDWDAMKRCFPSETQQYVPALIAVWYVYTFRKELNL